MEFRIEHDAMGSIKVPAGKYWGAQTQRAIGNFRFGGRVFSMDFIRAFALVKKASAMANVELERLPASKGLAIIQAADEIISGNLEDNFPLPIWQTGSGTQTNMNLNEVIANRACELAGGVVGSKMPVHPNDDVNMSQSTNDSFPTAMHVVLALVLRDRLLLAVEGLKLAFEQKAQDWETIVKIGRTHMMDATPLTLGQEFSGYAAQLAAAGKAIQQTLDGLYDLAIGGTAVGTGINAPRGFGDLVARKISELTGLPFRAAPNRFAGIAAHDAVVAASGGLRLLAVSCLKIVNDLRLLGSGPRCGLGELKFPANEPGSSIMPGKVNPTQCEAMAMVCVHVIGLDTSITFAGALGQLELNVFKPLLLANTLESAKLIADACDSLREHCVVGLEPDRQAIQRHLDNSLMLVTALSPKIGYDQAARIAKTALDQGTSLRQAALESGLVTGETFDELVDPGKMTHS